jgi:hypothetical protein
MEQEVSSLRCNFILFKILTTTNEKRLIIQPLFLFLVQAISDTKWTKVAFVYSTWILKKIITACPKSPGKGCRYKKIWGVES